MAMPGNRAATFLLATLALLTAVGAFIFIGLTWSTPSGDALAPALPAAGFTIASLTFVVTGVVLTLRRPENIIGWLFLVAAPFTALDVFVGRYLLYTLNESPDTSLPDLTVLGGLANALWIVPMCAVVIVLMTFPEGRMPSRRWAQVTIALVVFGAIGILLPLLDPGPLAEPLQGTNPLGVGAMEQIEFLFVYAILGIGLIVVASAYALFRRFQRSSGDEREQLKWFAYVAAWFPPIVIGYVINDILSTPSDLAFYTLSLANILVICALPVAIGFAVLKYRLYDIDLLANRTLVYVPLTAILAGLFTASTQLFRAIFTEVSGAGSDSAVAISTLAVVAFFTPIKNQLQVVVDRYFKEPLDPSRPLKKLAQDARPVLSVLETRAFLQDFLDRARSAIDARGCSLVLDGAVEPLLISGDSDFYVLTYPLIAADYALGSFNVGASRSGKPYTPAQVETIEKETDVLARALELFLRSGAEIKRPSPLSDDSDVQSVVEAPQDGVVS